jgi:ribosomal protein L32
MMKLILVSIFLLTSFLLDVPPVNTVCICAKAKVHDGWCDPCKFGFVAGLKIPSKLLFTTIDHGHAVEADLLRCDSCKKMLHEDGFCEACRIGFYKGKMYFSPFTHFLALGVRISRADLTCETCRKNTEDGGWCETCKRGIFGNVSVTQRKHFDEAVALFRRLKLGLQHLEPCELCGIAMYSNGMCPKCRLVYKDGKGSPE